MNTKYLVIFIAIVLATNCYFSFNYIESCKADILPKFYVDDDYNNFTPGWQIDHFDVIQDAIDASESGDRIIVYAGTYNEILNISHKLDLFGEDKNLSIIDGGNIGNVITISASYVNISHFTIRDCINNVNNATIKINAGNSIITDNVITSPSGYNGIFIDNCDNNIIYDNSIINHAGIGIRLNHSDANQITYNNINSNLNGLFLSNSSNNTIQNNAEINSNDVNGLFLNETSNYNTISNNIFLNNIGNGIFLNDYCDFNTFSNNQITSNNDCGIRIENSSSNTIDNSSINSNNNYGIMVSGSYNIVRDSIISSNGEHGLFLFADDNNIITENIISSNTKDGISLSNSTLDYIYTNEIKDNLRFGINLDFFTFSNTIYNNYIHDNFNNGIDKSINHNIWNITKTSGTNIVGGSYLSGNYWDSFDESTEGANDSDVDGIADNAYNIYGSNLDYGPILDIVSPIIGNPQVSPASQTIGSYTNISVQITDNTEIKEVYINIIDPMGQVSNFSIIGNQTGNVWYCNEQFTQLGLFTFHIAAKDPRNWETSISKTFYIHEGIPPTIKDNSPNTGSPSTTYTFNVTVEDDQDLASDLIVKVEWNHGEKSGNYSMNNIFKNYFIATITLDDVTTQLSYAFFAKDSWGNSIKTNLKQVSITDNTPPEIIIDTYGPSSDNMPNKYYFGATVIDNYMVKDVRIEYWSEGINHVIVDMDLKNQSYYYKEILLNKTVDRVYCIIYANDPSGNTNNTKSPFANISGPYSGIVAIDVNFNGSQSFDLDGNITKYEWDFGDGTTGSGEMTNHIYTSSGNYSVTLTVTDDDGNTNSCRTVARINSSVKKTTSISTLDVIKSEYGINLSGLFYSYDTNGDGIVDKFIDPNNVLVPVHSNNIEFEGDIIYLLSYDSIDIPNFIWNSSTDKIIMINYTLGEIVENVIDEEDRVLSTLVKVEKNDNWIYLEISKPDINDFGIIDSLISVTKNGIKIDSDKIIQKEHKIYVLDDPVDEYIFRFSYKPPPLTLLNIIPESGIINQNNPTIKFSFNYPVTITYADFYIEDLSVELEIIDNIITKDHYIFSYTPPSNLKKGIYYFDIDVIDEEGNSLTIYNYFQFEPYVIQKSEFSFYSLFILLGVIGAAGVFFYLIIRYKYINLESFVYIKNKKIIPFFKPIVFGPLRLDVNDDKIKKAEFFIDGELKTTLTEAPFIWNWNESSFMKKTIETKVYDKEGNAESSGEMTFFIFNSPRLFK